MNGVGDILEAALDSAKTFADGTKAEPIANALQNAGYTGVAVAQIIQGATQGLKGLKNGWQDAIDTLKKGWGDDWEDLKLKDRFQQIFKKLDLDPKDLLSPKKAFEALKNWATTVNTELKDIISAFDFNSLDSKVTHSAVSSNSVNQNRGTEILIILNPRFLYSPIFLPIYH